MVNDLAQKMAAGDKSSEAAAAAVSTEEQLRRQCSDGGYSSDAYVQRARERAEELRERWKKQ